MNGRYKGEQTKTCFSAQILRIAAESRRHERRRFGSNTDDNNNNNTGIGKVWLSSTTYFVAALRGLFV